MFSSLKEKLLNVKQNVILFNGEENSSKSPNINLYAGADILQHFQNQWEEIHKVNEENSSAADRAAEEIEKIAKTLNASKGNIALITHILTSSKLATNVSDCLNKIKNLYTLSETVEKELINLEDLIDQIEFENLQKQHHYHLKQYEKRKNETLETFKTVLEEKHLKKLAEYEESKKSVMEERQKVFQNAFKTDLDMYRNLGTIPEINLPRTQNGALLEEIQLDFDQKELDQFFNDNDKT